MIVMFEMPEWITSSTPYWMSGLSTSGNISFGCALVAGRKRVPNPAAGNTAFLTFWGIGHSALSTQHSAKAGNVKTKLSFRVYLSDRRRTHALILRYINFDIPA